MLHDAMPARAKVAVFIKNPLQRGVVTAFSWFLPNVKAFKPGEEDQACAHLQLTPDERRAVIQADQELQLSLYGENAA